MDYIRNPNCECSSYLDLETLSVEERLNIKDFWLKGYINTYVKDNSTERQTKECSCHKIWRYLKRYEILAEKENLPSSEELNKLKYLGEPQYPGKLGKALDKVFENGLTGVVFYLYGQPNCQKTTTCAKLLRSFLTKEKTCGYFKFTDLMKKISDEEEVKSICNQLKTLDLIIVEDCFENEDVVFKHKYLTFYNSILNRKGPTILTSTLSLEDLEGVKGKTLPSYNLDSIKKLKLKTQEFKSCLPFTDNIELAQKGLLNFDLWS